MQPMGVFYYKFDDAILHAIMAIPRTIPVALTHSPVKAMDFVGVFFICREQRMMDAMFVGTPRKAPMSDIVHVMAIPIKDKASPRIAKVMLNGFGMDVGVLMGEGTVLFPQY